ncbi:MAG: response regulator [Pseudomonadota bacterium]
MTEKKKTKILFVDDEVNILKGLQRSLRPLRDYWDMSFAEGAENALQTLEQENYDVILSDMRMPGMDGSKLLEIVRTKYPMMIRMILSGHSDKEMIMKSVKAAHQYLSKPCEKETLVSAITRACSLRDILHNKALKDLLGGIETMPSIPALYAKIMAELNSADASVASVGDIIQKDMGMTAKILQLVNSSFFGMPRHIGSAKEAVVLLGIDVVKTLVLGIEVFSKFSKALSVISVDAIHDHCVRTAVIAKKIALHEKMDGKKADNAMICATLHDLGRLLLAEHFSKEYSQVMTLIEQKKMPVFEAEKQVFKVSHAEVGAYLLGLWGLPQTIVEGIAFHHSPARVASRDFELSGMVHVADMIEHHAKNGGPSELEAILAGLDTAYMDKRGLTGKLPGWQALAVNRAEE